MSTSVISEISHDVLTSAELSLSCHTWFPHWIHFPRYWPFVRRIHRSPVNSSPHKGQWRGALTFSLIYAWINGWVNKREAGVYSIVFQAQIKENIKAPRHWPLWGEYTDDRLIPRRKGQWRGKCFHLLTSPWSTQPIINLVGIVICFHPNFNKMIVTKYCIYQTGTAGVSYTCKKLIRSDEKESN